MGKRRNQIGKVLGDVRPSARVTEDSQSAPDAVSGHIHTEQATAETARFFALIPDLMCVAGVDGYFKKLNPTWQELLGYTIEELLSRPFAEFIHPDDLEPTLREVQRQVNGGTTIDFVNRYRCKDGVYRWLEWRATPAVDGTCLYAAARDVTERKQAQEALREREVLLNQSQHLAQLGHYVFDVAKGLWTSSPALDVVFGIGPDHPKTFEGWLALVHPRDRDEMSSYVTDHVVGSGKAFDKEYRVIRQSDLSERWVHGLGELDFDDAGRVIRMFGVIQDITERKQAEELLAASEEKFSKAFRLSPDAININRLSDGCYIDINQGFTEITGYTQEDVIGRSSLPCDLGIWVHAEDRARMTERLRQDGEVVGFEAGFRKKDGSVVIGLMSAKIVTISDEPCILSITRDITERRRAEEERHALEQSLEEHKRKFYRETILSVTDGKLSICDQCDVQPYIDSACVCIDVGTAEDVGKARAEATAIFDEMGLEKGQLHEFVIACGEAITNALKHGGGGRVYAGGTNDQVWLTVADEGPGIESLVLPGAVLRRGFSTKPSMGLGYSIILDVVDRTLLKTDPNGTCVVLIKQVREVRPSLDSIPDTWAGIPDSI